MTQISPTGHEDLQSAQEHTLHPMPETTSDNDASEKQAREKLKKTSLATLSQQALKPQDSTPQTEAKLDKEKAATQHDTTIDEVAEDDMGRGRPVKKRSFDDLEGPEEGANMANHAPSPAHGFNGHVRKRSRDVRAGESFQDNRQPRAVDATVQEEAEEASTRKQAPEPMRSDSEEASRISEKVGQETLPSTTTCLSSQNDMDDVRVGQMDPPAISETSADSGDHKMRDLASSPRKKRSRDDLDNDVDREQKIPATEEARAQRVSDELERKKSKDNMAESPTPPNESTQLGQKTIFGEAVVRSSPVEPSGPQETRSNTFEGSSIASPFTKELRSLSPSAAKSETQPQTSATAFAASGFAALSKSTVSPFGALGASSNQAPTPASLLASTSINPKDNRETSTVESNASGSTANGGLSTFAKASPSTFGASTVSPFGRSGTASNSVFGGSISGGGFGGGPAAGNKLTSFAAPTGDTKTGPINGTIKPIGSLTNEDDDGENSEGDEEGADDNENYDDEVDDRFQHQDVETGEDDEVTIYTSRASLYIFKDKSWKEGGAGVFKLNKNTSPDSGQISGRFIMRAHQTFRVLLNAPILKAMKVGDGRGNEPDRKSFQFAAIESGKVVPHLLKLSSAEESKKLYHEVRNLQKDMVDI